MLVVFSKRNGNIKGIYSGELQSMDILYGEDSADYKLIWDEVTLTDDDFVIRNYNNFKINLQTKQLEIKPEAVSQYPIASV